MDDVLKKLKEEGDKSIDHFKKELGRVRSGRATTTLLEGVTVDYYGSQCPLVQLALVAAPEPRMLTVQVYDRGAVESVEKAILQADLGLNPSRDGTTLRIVVPALTDERRKEIVKKLHKEGEEARVAVRNIRRHAIDTLKKREKDKEVTEDELRRGQQDVQKITDGFIAAIDQLLKKKEEEVTSS